MIGQHQTTPGAYRSCIDIIQLLAGTKNCEMMCTYPGNLITAVGGTLGKQAGQWLVPLGP